MKDGVRSQCLEQQVAQHNRLLPVRNVDMSGLTGMAQVIQLFGQVLQIRGNHDFLHWMGQLIMLC
jgi:hypothetical protein